MKAYSIKQWSKALSVAAVAAGLGILVGSAQAGDNACVKASGVENACVAPVKVAPQAIETTYQDEKLVYASVESDSVIRTSQAGADRKGNASDKGVCCSTLSVEKPLDATKTVALTKNEVLETERSCQNYGWEKQGARAGGMCQNSGETYSPSYIH